VPESGQLKRDQILSAAAHCFGRYGYRRTSMETIAQAAKVSRPALYQYFTGKEEVFRAMGVRMLDAALTQAEVARHGEAPVADKLHAVLVVKLDLVVGPAGEEFRRELIAETATIAADLLASFHVRLTSIVEDLLVSAAEELSQLRHRYPPHDTAVLLLDAVAGIAQEDAAAPTLRERLRQLVELAVDGLGRP
jgi:TetR/AcrR family transcriptional regulator